MKFFLLIVFIVLISCTKQKEIFNDCVEITVTTYVNGEARKITTAPWYSNQDLNVRDTIWCNGEMIVTSFHKCKK